MAARERRDKFALETDLGADVLRRRLHKPVGERFSKSLLFRARLNKLAFEVMRSDVDHISPAAARSPRCSGYS
jgi:hypothetical protein